MGILVRHHGVAQSESGDIVTNLQYQIDQLREYLESDILSNQTKYLYGFDETATPDDIFIALRLETDYYAYKFYVYLSNGKPAKGVTITGTGLEKLTGSSSTNITDANGYCIMRSKSTSISSVNITSPYIDQKSTKVDIISSGLITTIKVNLEYNSEQQTVTSTRDINISQATNSTIFTLVGGGGGGGGGTGGGGGGGGYVTTYTIQNNSKDITLRFNIASGGNGGTNVSSIGNSGNNGGTTSIMYNGERIISADGGSGGGGSYGGENNQPLGSGGLGNGNGGRAGNNAIGPAAGSDGSGYIFDNPTLGIAGGGGGGGGAASVYTNTDYIAKGGLPYGGSGGKGVAGNTDRASPTNGLVPGGGGGGASISGMGANGGNGMIYLKCS